MRFIKIFIISIVAVAFAGCGTVKMDHTYGPTVNRFYMSDLEYIGEAEVEVTYSRYLFLFRKIHTVNNEQYDPTKKKYAYLDVDGGNLIDLKKASYKVMEEFPEGRYFKVVRRTEDINRLFLGKEVQEKAVIRVYKYKN